MAHTALLYKNLKLYISMFLLALIGGYVYVQFMSYGYRGIIFIHLTILFFVGIAIFLRNLKPFLIFSLITGVAFHYGYFLVFDMPKGSQAPPFILGIRLEATDIVLIICYIYWGMSLTSKGGTGRPVTLGGRVGVLFLAWILFVLMASIISATNRIYSLYEAITLFKGFLFYFYLVNNIRDENDLKIVAYSLCGGGVIEASFMMVQFIGKKNYMIQPAYETGFTGETFRSIGFLGHPDACIIFLATVVPILVIGLLIVRNDLKKLLIGFSLFLILLAAIVSQTRIAAAVFGIGIITSLLVGYRRGWVSKGQIITAVAAMPVVLMVFVALVYQRFATAAWGEERWPLAVTAYEIFKSHFIFGVGSSNYVFVVEKFIPASEAGKWVFTVHVEYLLRLAENGILGFLIFYSFILSVTANFYRSTFSKDPLIFAVSCGLFSSLIASFVHRITSIYHIPQVFFLMCTIYALSVVVGSIEKPIVSESGHQKFNQSFASEQ